MVSIDRRFGVGVATGHHAEHYGYYSVGHHAERDGYSFAGHQTERDGYYFVGHHAEHDGYFGEAMLCGARHKSLSRGITLIELIVVVAIMGVLMSLLLLGVSTTRESARLTQCSNNIRQLGLATTNFVSAHRHFPSNGWGYAWIGQLDRGVGPQQPGGWAFQILPFAEISLPLHKTEDDASRASWMQLDFSVFRCPNRPMGLSPHTDLFTPRNATVVQVTAKTDYAICEGDYITNTGEGPRTLEEGDSASYRWPKLPATGISFQRSRVRPADVIDGLSMTYALGEKNVARSAYRNLDDLGYDQSLLAGVDLDLNRWVDNLPMRDSKESYNRAFGSAHAAGWNAVLCDGSVRRMTFDIDPLTHARLGNRLDGLTVSVEN